MVNVSSNSGPSGTLPAVKGDQGIQGEAAAPVARKAVRGFAAMDPALQRRIASEGGRAAHASGNAHEFTSEEARAAGSKSRTSRAAKASVQALTAPD